MDKVINKIERSKEIRAFNEDSTIVASADLIHIFDQNQGSSISLTMPILDMSPNKFTGAQSKGDIYVNFDLVTVRDLSTAQLGTSRDQIVSGQYRLFINTKTNKAHFE